MSIALGLIGGVVLALMPLLFSQLITHSGQERNQGIYRAMALAVVAVIALIFLSHQAWLGLAAFVLTALWRVRAWYVRVYKRPRTEAILDQAVSPEMQITLAQLEQEARLGAPESATDSTNPTS